MKAKIDVILSKWLSRKLMVFAISAVALFSGRIDGDAWIILATAYIGVEGTIDAVTRLKGLTRSNEEQSL